MMQPNPTKKQLIAMERKGQLNIKSASIKEPVFICYEYGYLVFGYVLNDNNEKEYFRSRTIDGSTKGIRFFTKGKRYNITEDFVFLNAKTLEEAKKDLENWLTH